MDFRELRYFAHVARAGSFSRAANELRIAQPALSRQIRKLEEELGAPLLVRHGRGVRLTGAGSLLLERAETLSHLLHQTADEVRANGNTLTGHLSIGVPPAAGLLIVPAMVEQFRKLWPRVSLHVREGISTSLQEWLLDRRVDVALVHNPAPLDALHIVPILKERMILVGPPAAGKSGSRQKRSYQIRDLTDLPLILPSLPHNNRRLVEQAAVMHGVRLGPVIEVDSVALTKSMVRAGLGYTILTVAAVQDETARGDLTAYDIERPPLTSTVAIASLREMQPSRLVAELSRVLRATAHDLIARGAWTGATIYGPPAKDAAPRRRGRLTRSN